MTSENDTSLDFFLSYRPEEVEDRLLGDKIIKSTSFALPIHHSGLFWGLRHLPMIKAVTFVISNYQTVYHLPAQLLDGVWRATHLAIPLQKLPDFGRDLQLELQIETNGEGSHRFHSFIAAYRQPLSKEQQEYLDGKMLLILPCCQEGVSMEFIGNIWRCCQTTPSK